jgi:hypothetical protein
MQLVLLAVYLQQGWQGWECRMGTAAMAAVAGHSSSRGRGQEVLHCLWIHSVRVHDSVLIMMGVLGVNRQSAAAAVRVPAAGLQLMLLLHATHQQQQLLQLQALARMDLLAQGSL